MRITRAHVLRFRHHQHGLSGEGTADDSAILDLGVQDTGGPDAARWALAVRGCHPEPEDLALVWTLRGAPHVYRRREVAEVAAATAPYDEVDAAKRIFDAARPLKAAGIAILDALDTVAAEMRDIVRGPTVKGEVSAALTPRLPDPFLRTCRPCQAIHTYEQPFRLAALRGGLELVAGTSPPVLRRIEGWTGPAADVPAHLDPIRAALHLLGPTTPKLVAGFLDAPVRTVASRWPDDVVGVTLDGEPRSVLAADAELLADPPTAHGVRMLGAFDLWLQVRDRDLLVADDARRADVWRTLGRPGAVLDGAEIVGTWRPRSSGDRLRVVFDPWDREASPSGLEEQAERLAAHRGQRFDGVVAP